MALQVWLPLTKDLRNQGLSDQTSAIITTPTWATVGKLGGKSLYTKTRQTTMHFPGLVGISTYSVAYWLYIPTAIASTSWADMFGIAFNCAGTTVWERDERRAAATTGRHNYHLAKSASEGSNTNAYYGTREDDSANDNWVHYVLTKDDSSAKLYANGTLVVTVPATNFESTKRIMTGDVYFGDNGCEAYLNDFRIYDHCLSEAEIKKLAQGLILHYPLNRQGWGQENLVTGTNPNDWHSLTLTDGTNQCINIFGDATRGYLQATTAGLEVGDVVHVSFDIKFSSNIAATNTGTNAITVQGSANNGATWGGLSYSATGCGGIQRTKINNIINSSSKQGRIHTWFIVTSAMLDGTYTGKLHTNIRFDYYTGIVYVKATKVEKGINATPWCPNSADELATTLGLNNEIEYDISGFRNNGTRVGTFEWTSDTPKYEVSQYFNGSSYIKTLPGEFSWSNYDSLTIAAWIKPTVTPSTWTGSIGIASDASSYTNKAVAISNYGGKFSIHIPNGSSWGVTQSTYTMPLNTWHHCVATINDTTVNMYIDGVLNKTFTANFGTATNHASPQIQVGVDLPGGDEIYQGYYSDVRIYATALSADDVKSLYQNCATIAADGTVYGQIRS